MNEAPGTAAAEPVPGVYKPCLDGHSFTYMSTKPTQVVDEGMPCACGKFKAHWEKCSKCGAAKLQLVPAPGPRLVVPIREIVQLPSNAEGG